MPNVMWRQCLNALQTDLPPDQFNTWVRPLQAHFENGQLHLYAPNRFVMNWVKDKYLPRIDDLLCTYASDEMVAGSGAAGGAIRVCLQIGSAPKLEIPLTDAQTDPIEAESTGAAGSRTKAGSRAKKVEDGHQKGVVPENESRSSAAKRRVRSATLDSGGSLIDSSLVVKHENALNRDFLFSTFVEGKSNQLARAAAIQVSDNPGNAFNPLFLYGGVGLGKTHLMHAVGHEIVARKPNARVVYLHSERFVQDMVKALRMNAINDFKKYYRSVDALLIDDIQFFAKKERSQEEFFHTFNALLEGGQQMILTSDRYPKEIENMEERLKSRFGWGLTVMVEPPELETRVAILMKKAEQSGIELTSECAFFIAQKIRANVRELEGALRLVIANAHFTGNSITPEFIRECLKDLLALHEKQVSLDNIQRTVAEYYKIRVSDLLSKRRTRSITRPRQLAMCLAKELTQHSLPEIGDAFGGRDHTTVLHACRMMRSLQQTDATTREDYQYFMRSLTG